MLKIKTMEDTFQEDHIIGILQNRDGSILIESVERIYYPYVKLIYSFKLSEKLSKLNNKMMCNVDLIYGRHAIGQGKPTFIELEVEDHLVLPTEISEEKALKDARDYVFKIFISKMKILQTPTIELDDMEYFHKLFFIANCKDQDDQDYCVLVDSMDGSLVVLD